MDSHNHPVLFFDGECNLCNGAVRFIIRHDKEKIFRFAALQSEAGKEALKQFNGEAPDSVIVFYDNRYFVKSAAALRVFRLLGGGWKILYTGVIIPAFLRDWVYDLISRNRYKWFGKRNECMVPTPDLKERFLS